MYLFIEVALCGVPMGPGGPTEPWEDSRDKRFLVNFTLGS